MENQYSIENRDISSSSTTKVFPKCNLVSLCLATSGAGRADSDGRAEFLQQVGDHDDDDDDDDDHGDDDDHIE